MHKDIPLWRHGDFFCLLSHPPPLQQKKKVNVKFKSLITKKRERERSWNKNAQVIWSINRFAENKQQKKNLLGNWQIREDVCVRAQRFERVESTWLQFPNSILLIIRQIIKLHYVDRCLRYFFFVFHLLLSSIFIQRFLLTRKASHTVA